MPKCVVDERLNPLAVLLLPVVLLKSELKPMAVLLLPMVLSQALNFGAMLKLTRMPVLSKPVVLFSKSASEARRPCCCLPVVL